jgi:hypothetical protein
MTTDTLSFGSCNRQRLPQTFWETISHSNPSHFFWTGDAVYGKSNSVDGMITAFKNLTDNALYQNFTDNVVIDGVWDDHDYGVNDGGNHAENIPERQLEYLRFLARSNNERNIPSHTQREGLYHSTDLTLLGAISLKIIFLDTRSFRDPHWIRSLGEHRFPLSSLIASALRGVYSTLGYGRDYTGKILGETQWLWLTETLSTTTADVNIVVSSIQVLTTNPIFESWGHFPLEKARLLSLFQSTDPKGLVILSGDVHLGEVSAASYRRADGSEGQWAEVTSSGLTHTCADGTINMVLCPLMMMLFTSHRKSAGEVYIGRNFGLITAKAPARGNPEQTQYIVDVSVQSLPMKTSTKLQNHFTQSETMLSHRLVIGKAPPSRIEYVFSHDFFTMSSSQQVVLLAMLLVAMAMTRRWWASDPNARGKTY